MEGTLSRGLREGRRWAVRQLGESSPGRENTCKGPGVGVSVECLRSSQEASAPQQTSEEETGG